MSLEATVRYQFEEWQGQGYEERPVWYDTEIDNQLNQMSHSEFLIRLSDAIESMRNDN
jgi:hypothetical protein